MLKKIFVMGVVVVALGVSVTNAAYKTVDCSSDTVFSENSCNQCFDGGVKNVGSNVAVLSDIWKNDSKNAQLIYEEQQRKPEMINLNTDKVTWKQTPSAENFWIMPTDELKALYDKEKYGYVLPAGQQVTWIKSQDNAAYTLEASEAAQGSNIGLLVFPIIKNNIMDDGEVSLESKEHKECVLFKAGNPTKPNKPKELPKTGPAQFLVLLVLAMILAFGILRFKKS